MIVLGLDPGLATTGYGFVQAGDKSEPSLVTCGVVRTPSDRDHADRLAILSDALRQLIQTHDPDEAAVEELYFSKNVKTALTVGEARGVLNLTLHRCGLPIRDYNPTSIKKTVAGHGEADKTAMKQSVQRDLSLDAVPSPADAADALAVALCHTYRSQSGIPEW